MADVFVWSGATGLNNGSQWEDAYTSLMRDYGAEAGFTPGTDFVYVRSIHDEDIAAVQILIGSTAKGTLDPVRVLCVVGAATGTNPGALAVGAIVRTNGAYNISIDEKLYVYGVKFLSDKHIGLGATSSGDHQFILEKCRLELVSVSATDAIIVGIDSVDFGFGIKLLDTDVDFAAAGQGFNINQSRLLWDSGSLGFNVTYLFEAIAGRQANVVVRNVDLSICSGTLVNCSAADVSDVIRFERCLLNPAVTIDETIDIPGLRVETYLCQAGGESDPAYQMRVRTYQGVTKVDIARYRTGGASDGERTNPYSWSMDTSLGSNVIELYEPLESPPITRRTPGDGSTPHTYRIYIASGAVQQNDEVWMDIYLPNDAAQNSLGVRKSTRAAPLATPVNLTTDGVSTWNGVDVGTKQYVEVTHTPDKPGEATARVYLAMPSERVCVDLKLYIDP